MENTAETRKPCTNKAARAVVKTRDLNRRQERNYNRE